MRLFIASLVGWMLLAPASLGGAGAAAPAPTRLVHEPLFLRLTNAKSDPLRSDYRYVLLYRLNRDLKKTGIVEGSTNIRGNLAIFDKWTYDLPRTPSPFGGRKGCLAFVLVDGSEALPADTNIGKLDKLRIGDRVRIRIQPLTPGPSGDPVLGKNYIRHPRLRRADIKFRGKDIRRWLKHMGCNRTPLPLWS